MVLAPFVWVCADYSKGMVDVQVEMHQGV